MMKKLCTYVFIDRNDDKVTKAEEVSKRSLEKGAGLVCIHEKEYEEVMYFMFSMNKYRKDEEFEKTLNSLKNNFQTCRM